MNVRPMNSGTIVHDRDHVLIGSRLPLESCASTFSNTRGSTYGPFFALRPMMDYLSFSWPYRRLFRRRIMAVLDGFRGLRVPPPLALLPVGLTG